MPPLEPAQGLSQTSGHRQSPNLHGLFRFALHIGHSGAGVLRRTNSCLRDCKCRGGAVIGGATKGIESDDCRTYSSNDRSEHNREGNDAYVAS